jgi:ligand-binding SRPBCC domain-containing protein
MTEFRIETIIAAPIEVCFDLSRDIDFHVRTMAESGERAVAGRTTGLIELGESVTWEAKHLGVRQRLTARITAFERPYHFRDEMTAGAFRSLVHDHRFEVRDGRTVMVDTLTFRSPYGPIGWLVDRIFMKRYLQRLLSLRCVRIRCEAETLARRPDAVE